MSFAERVEYVKRLHALIRRNGTGTPEQLASRLEKSRATIYRHLDDLRSLGAEIGYCKKTKTYYYEQPFELPFH